jgi:lysyl-tRNA synthetase class 2
VYLQTSPEYFMKRLLCSGFPDIYSIGKVFRDGESGRRHQPEFTMVEWYRLGFGMQDMIDECCAFIVRLVDRRELNSGPDIIDYADAFARFAGIDPFRARPSVLADACDADDRLREVLGDDRDAWLDLLMTQKVIPALATDRLSVIRHYPASQGALARICPGDASLADRFEVFFADLELANGYVELRDAGEQRERWQRDLRLRKIQGKDAVPQDDRLLEAMQHGLPACAGVAVGFDRLVMLDENVDDIAQVQSFVFEDSPQS